MAAAAKPKFCLSAPQQSLAASQQQQLGYGHGDGLSFQLRQSGGGRQEPLFASLTLSAAAADAVSAVAGMPAWSA